ncbi:MAG: hypothetical protein JSW25_00580 [Thermoplasmata archaeon]|nr:MAG: hypothetical protein JSW25_00580 [Thermoplasmata archaeon]
MEFAEWLSGVLWLIVAIISIVPISIFFRAYRSVPSRKLLYTTVAFCLFFVMGILLSLHVIFPGSEDSTIYLEEEVWWSVSAFLCLAIIGLFVMALTTKE